MPEIDLDQLAKLEVTARILAGVLRRAADELSGPKKTGFCLMLFSFNGPELTYISNARREDMIKALDEFREKLKNRADDELDVRQRRR